ncbi:hypothetical protein OC835_000263 [Tilletia horrida]|nr:hypothetical protein OC835_000263 [Tilletia horrida]
MAGSTTLSDSIGSVLDRTGLILPVVIVTLLALGIVYHDRAVFTKPARPGLFRPPVALPLIGQTVHAARLGAERELDAMLEFTRSSAIGGWQISIVGQGNILFLSRPEYIEAIQKTHFDNFVKGDFFRDRLADVLGQNGIFVADGHVWKHSRKTASHIFSAGQFRNWVQVVVHDELEKVVSILKASSSAAAASSSSRSGDQTSGIITLPELFFRYTLNSFSRMAFSSDIGCLTHDPTCLSTPVEFATAFDYAQVVINKRLMLPAFRVVEALTGTGKKMDQAITTIQNFAGGIIDDRLRAAQAKTANEAANPTKPTHEGGSLSKLAKKDGKDLLDLFLESVQDRDELLTIVLNFLIAGRDTTAQLLSWFFYEMIAHPEHVDEIRKELSEVLGDCPAEGYRLPYDQMRDLPYTFACITEALRLHPSVPKNAKLCVKDTLLVPSGPNPTNLPPVQVYKGEMVGWSDWVMARLPEVWGPDCEEYKPSRFLEEEVDSATGVKRRTVRQYSQWQQHMFNGGPRLCLGMNLANYEALSLVAAVVPLFDFHWATAEQGQTVNWPPTYVSSLTHPMESYKVEFRRRRV